MFEFKMPSMGADMESAVLVQWNYAVGDVVQKGEVICEIETAKGNIDVEVWESGTISELLVEPGAKIPVGEVMARLDTGVSPLASAESAAPSPVDEAAEPPVEELAAEAPTQPRRPARQEQVTVVSQAVRPVRSPTSDTARVAASPAARRRAAELGVGLDALVGSGPGGAVKLEDVEHPAGHERHRRISPVARKMAADAGINPEDVTPTGVHDLVTKDDVKREVAAKTTGGDGALRDAIAKAMAKSKREIPHYYLKATFDVTPALDWMEAQNAERGVATRLVFGALIARAVALAAHDIPEMNGFYVDGAFRPSLDVHLGFAVAMRGGGVVAPAIHGLADKTLDEAMAGVKDLVRRVRKGKLRSSEMTDSTLTLTSLGDMGVDTVFGIIYPPQVAIVGFGSPREIPFASNGMIGVHTCVDVTLSGDHRVSDGLTGARFLQRIRHYLDQPEVL